MTGSVNFETIYRQAEAMYGQDVETIHFKITTLLVEVLKMSSRQFVQFERAMDLHFSKPLSSGDPLADATSLVADSIMVKLEDVVNTYCRENDRDNLI